MLASRSTTIGKSTNSSKLGSSSVAGKHKKDSFLVYCYKKFMTMCTAIWGRTRKTLWILSTGFILLILPFTFAYLSEFQKEASKIMGAQQRYL